MGLLRMAARTAVVAGTATAVAGRVQRRQASKWDQQDAQEQQQYAQEQQQPQYEQAPEAEDDATAQLQNLAKLHTQGVLTDDEFAAAKAKILGI